MSTPDYDDPDVEERWCSDQRRLVDDYLRSQGVEHGQIGEWPAWHIAPYVSIWAVESRVRPGSIGKKTDGFHDGLLVQGGDV